MVWHKMILLSQAMQHCIGLPYMEQVTYHLVVTFDQPTVCALITCINPPNSGISSLIKLHKKVCFGFSEMSLI